MNALADLSTQLCGLLQSPGCGAVPGAVAASPLRCAIDGGRWVALHFEAQQQRWLLGVGCATQQLEEGARARLEEALLRVGHDSRWSLQQTGLGNGQDLQLIDCDFPCCPAQLTPIAVETQLHALLTQLDALIEGRPSCPGAPIAHGPARGCSCFQAFSARMRALDAQRAPASIAPQELLLEDGLALRISLHPRSHHWLFEAFVGHAAALAAPLRRSLVAALLRVNGAVLSGQCLVCSLDGGDRVVVISRWHADWSGRTPVLAWLDYSTRQARRLRAAVAAIAMQDDGGSAP